MRPLILSFFAVILVYSLFFDESKEKSDGIQFGMDSSMNIQEDTFNVNAQNDSVKYLVAFKEGDSMQIH